jgi:hypothetical protein
MTSSNNMTNFLLIALILIIVAGFGVYMKNKNKCPSGSLDKYENNEKWYCVEGKCQQDMKNSYTGKAYRNKQECETDANSSCSIAIIQPKAEVKWEQPEAQIQIQHPDNGYKIIEEKAIIVRGPPPKEYLPDGYPMEDIRDNESASENYKQPAPQQQMQMQRRQQNRVIPSIRR